MKLLHSPTSPYARKAYACALALGFEERVELVPTNPHVSPADLLALNPLSKIPCLIADDGTAIFDSPVIAEYLDSLGGAVRLFPQAGPARWEALRLQALADGIMDAAVGRRMEMGRPPEDARNAVMARSKDAVARSLDVLEASELTQELTIGTIAVACALGYLTLRFSDEPWREGHPRLTAWFAKFGLTPCIANTKPKA
jgi:glutathione S-transferase